MSKNLYIIKGTGLALDGQLVKVVEWVGDYAVVSPPNSRATVENTMVKKPCLQPVDEKQSVTYEIIIYKRDRWPSHGTDPLQVTQLAIVDCPRDVSVETLKEYLDTNLTPILRMEK